MNLRRLFVYLVKKMTFLPQKYFLPALYEYYTGKKLNFDDPKEFNAKIQWYKRFYHPKLLNQLVDKYAVRAYVEEKIGVTYLNELYSVYDSIEEVDFDLLPDRFVVKAVHASSYNLICKDKNELDVRAYKRTFRKWFSTNQYYRTGQEWAYKDVKPRLIVEKFIEDDQRDSLTDYKFYCFDGVAKFIEVHIDRDENHRRGFYDLDFKRLPYRYVSIEKSISEELEKPDKLQEMISLSEKLAENLPFVRVDFYFSQGRIIFGELTFYPSDGRKDFYPAEYNRSIGDLFKLPDLNGRNVITNVV